MGIKVERFQYQSGVHRYVREYRYFLPALVNQSWSWEDPQLNRLVEKAAIRLGELNAMARMLPDAEHLFRLHVACEAIQSCKMAGCGIAIDDALMPKESVDPDQADNWQANRNCIDAIDGAMKDMKQVPLPLASEWLRESHRRLLRGIAGNDASRGEFRRSQGWIGGDSRADASFVPPAGEHVAELMDDLGQFLLNPDIELPALIRIAIAHYQFETIHPFQDGNGRIGRLMIPCLLLGDGVAGQPFIGVSAHFARDCQQYCDFLGGVREHRGMLKWLQYFVRGVERSAEDALERLYLSVQLKEELERRINRSFASRSCKATRLLRHLFARPIISMTEAASVCEVTFRTASSLIESMREHGMLFEVTGQRRNRLFRFDPYLEIFRN